MPTFKLPPSGDVVRSINPFTAWMSPAGSQFGLINLGQSGEPKVEKNVLAPDPRFARRRERSTSCERSTN